MLEKIKILSIVTVLSSIIGSNYDAANASLEIKNRTDKIILWSIGHGLGKFVAEGIVLPRRTGGTPFPPNSTKHRELLCVRPEGSECLVKENYDHDFKIECDT